MSYFDILANCGLSESDVSGGTLQVFTPVDGVEIANLSVHSVDDVSDMIAKSKAAFEQWRTVPAPRRGELVRLFAEELRVAKEDLGRLVALECGKIYQEGLGEVQEMIDICDFAVGLSRQLYGLTIQSERPGHHMRETWHPMGVCGIITAFNFPTAPWCWNTSLALVCGDPVIWKPSEMTPLTALACQKIFEKAAARFGDAPDNLSQIVIGGPQTGAVLTASKDVAIVSATGSTAMGRKVSVAVAERFGRSILELGGNNSMIVAPSADMEMAIRAIVFSAIGTCGQRCTTLRRVIAHDTIYDALVAKLKTAYSNVPISNPLEESALIGPLINQRAFDSMQSALQAATQQGGVVHGGSRALEGEYPNGYYVNPAIVEMPGQTDIVAEETFAPILYVMKYSDFQGAIALQNAVPQGLSSCIFSTDVRETEMFISDVGSDCGIANVNIGPSGAEIGGAFGGEKETGGGRESGSDAWRAYMRRQTNTVNYSTELPLAQGVKFDV